jgi:protein-export membrane protein SecD
MARKNAITLLIILAIFAFTLWALIPIQKEKLGQNLNLGLDLVGGVHLVYEVEFADNATAADKEATLARAVTTISNRIGTYGVTEPVIQSLGEERILIQLPGYTDIDAAKKLVEQTGYLEFREVEINTSGEPVYLSTYLSANLTDFVNAAETGNRVFVGERDTNGSSYPVAFMTKSAGRLAFTDANGKAIDKAALTKYGSSISWMPARGDNGIILTGDYLEDAQGQTDSSSVIPQYVVGIKWNEEGAAIFNQICARLYLRPADSKQRSIGIFLDNVLLSDPEILQSNYPDGRGQIQGGFTLQQVNELSNLLKSGALPVQLGKPLFQEKVSATLGSQFIDKAWLAGIIGIALVMLFMIAYYRLPGLLASLSLVFYGTLTLAIFKLWPAPQLTLTLAGLGGFIASIGMAVDANVLIFERMKEEFRMGRTLGAAIEAGFHRAWSAIRDSNITTFIACIILVIIGSNIIAGAPIKWFGITLFLGVLVSMFTAIFVTRTLLRLFIGTSLAKKSWLFTAGGGKK